MSRLTKFLGDRWYEKDAESKKTVEELTMIVCDELIEYEHRRNENDK